MANKNESFNGDINDKATYDYYHGKSGEVDDDGKTRLEPVYSHKRPQQFTDDFDGKPRLGEAIRNAENFKTPIRNVRPYGGMYRCRGEDKCCGAVCSACPVCVYNVPCCNDTCLWTIWCWMGIPLPWSFCTLFACEMYGPTIVTRGKYGDVACQYVKLSEHEPGYGCFGAQGCDGFKTVAGLRDDTPMCMKAEKGCC